MSEVVVVVDDEPYILHVLAIKLCNAGYEVFTAADGEEAIKVCLNEAPDLIITDYQMPGFNGLEFCLKYRESSGRKIPAILLPAREFDSEIDSTLQIVSAVESLPPPVVVVQDINEVQGETIAVEQRAII